ncbi:MAG: ATP-binding cassette domain-containing protein [Solirubrobacteraceae bacterium]
MSLFSFEHVTKRYTDGHRVRTVLEDVSFEIDAGDFVGLWGMRRSGKSTLLRVAASIELPDDGQIFFDGQELTKLSGEQRAEVMRANGIGFVSSDWRPVLSQKVIDYISAALLADKLSLKEARPIVREYLDRMGVLNCTHTLTDQLSIYDSMRVGLAHALVRKPRLLFVDEPAVVPSPSERQEFYELLMSLGKDSSLAVLIASEDLGAVSKARRMMTIGSGSLCSTDKEGKVVSFPAGRVSDGRSG